jgi:hypothetical protein
MSAHGQLAPCRARAASFHWTNENKARMRSAPRRDIETPNSSGGKTAFILRNDDFQICVIGEAYVIEMHVI